MIFVGVTTALYQVYETHYNINFGNEKKLSRADKSCLKELSIKAKNALQLNERVAFDQAVITSLGAHFDREIALAAFYEGKDSFYGAAMLRRKAKLIFKDNSNKRDKNIADAGDTSRRDIRVRHLPFLSTKLPNVNVRGLLITIVIANCFLTQLLGAMSIYTIHYEFSMPSLVWLNDPFVVMLLIYALIFITFVISKIDMYMHDLYQIGRLVRDNVTGDGSLHPA